MVSKKNVLLITKDQEKFDPKIEEVKALLSQDNEIEFLTLDLSNHTTFFSPHICPCVLICTQLQTSISFLKRYKDILRESSSKFCLFSKDDMTPKEENLVLVLGAAEVSSLSKLTSKTMSHKIKLFAKSLIFLDEEAQKILKLKHLNHEKKLKEPPQTRSEIDYEVIDFFVLEKFCSRSLRILGDLEGALEEYEHQPTSMQRDEIIKLFNEIRQGAYQNDFEVISDFLEIIKHILKRLNEIKDETFKSVVTGILFNLLDFMRTEITNIKNKKNKKQILDNPHRGLFSRLYWLHEKFKVLLEDETIGTELERIGIVASAQ